MAFSFVTLPRGDAQQADHLLPMVVCDHCYGPAGGGDAYVLFGPVLAEHPRVTSMDPLGAAATVRVACSPRCRDLLVAFADDPTQVGYAPLTAYVASLVQASGPITVTRVTEATQPRVRHTPGGLVVGVPGADAAE